MFQRSRLDELIQGAKRLIDDKISEYATHRGLTKAYYVIMPRDHKREFELFHDHVVLVEFSPEIKGQFLLLHMALERVSPGITVATIPAESIKKILNESYEELYRRPEDDEERAAVFKPVSITIQNTFRPI